MLAHAAHATATFAEVGMAISLGLMLKIIKPKHDPTDEIRRVTEKSKREQIKADRRSKTISDIENTDGKFLAVVHRVICSIKDLVSNILHMLFVVLSFFWEYFYYVTLVFALLALLGLAYCPKEEDWTLVCALASLLFAIWKAMHIHKSRDQKEGMLGVPIDPIPPNNAV